VLDTREILTEKLFIISKRKVACMAIFLGFLSYSNIYIIIFILCYFLYFLNMKHRTNYNCNKFKRAKILTFVGERISSKLVSSHASSLIWWIVIWIWWRI